MLKETLSKLKNKSFEIHEFKIYYITDEDMDQYSGVYSSKQVPLKIIIRKSQLEFNPANKTMVLKQRGENLILQKKIEMEKKLYNGSY